MISTARRFRLRRKGKSGQRVEKTSVRFVSRDVFNYLVS